MHLADSRRSISSSVFLWHAMTCSVSYWTILTMQVNVDFLTRTVLRLLKCVRHGGTHCQCLCHTSRSASPCHICALGVCRRFPLHYNSRCIQCYWKTNENAGQQGFIFLLRILSGCSVMSHLILLMLLIFFLIVIFIFRLLTHFIH